MLFHFSKQPKSSELLTQVLQRSLLRFYNLLCKPHSHIGQGEASGEASTHAHSHKKHELPSRANPSPPENHRHIGMRVISGGTTTSTLTQSFQIRQKIYICIAEYRFI
jgi:hypothetical protein